MADFVVRPIQAAELESAAHLVASIFSIEDALTYDAIYRFFTVELPLLPGFKMEHLRAGFHRGRLVSFLKTSSYTLHYGRARLHVTGIGAVCTHPDYRGRGYSGAVLRETLMYAAEQGTHLALLHGIPGYYERFGFMPVWPRYTFEAPVEQAVRLPQPLALREATPDDLPYLAHLYNKHWGTRVTFSRSPALWQWRMATQPSLPVLAVNGTGQIQGYVWHRRGDLSHRTEAVADSPEAVQTLLVYDGRRFKQGGQDLIQWSVPPDDIIVPHAQQLLPVTLSAHYTPSGHWMGRMIDSTAVVQTLLPEITAQAQAMSSHFDAGYLHLQMQSDGVFISMSNDPEKSCQLSLRDFIQIVFGSLRPATVAIRQKLNPASIELLELLFPPRIAALAPWDWF